MPGTLSAAEEDNFSGCVSGGEDEEQGVGPVSQKGKAKTNKLLTGGITSLCTEPNLKRLVPGMPGVRQADD